MKILIKMLAKNQSLRRKSFVMLTVAAMVPLFFTTKAVLTGVAQMKNEKKKKITRVSSPFEPLEIVSVGSVGKKMALGEKFEAEDDWLDDFSIKFINNTKKTIIYLTWQFDFPETASSGPVMVSANSYGLNPAFPRKGTSEEPPILPGEALEQSFDKKWSRQLKNFLEKRHSFRSLTHANIRVMEIRFSDGTGWNAGMETKEDSDKPGRFLPVRPYRPTGGKTR